MDALPFSPPGGFDRFLGQGLDEKFRARPVPLGHVVGAERPDEDCDADEQGARQGGHDDPDEADEDGQTDEQCQDVDGVTSAVGRVRTSARTRSPQRGAVLLGQSVRLVLDMHGDVGQGRGVAPGVVAAEEQLTGGQDDPEVGLRTAAVAAVGCGQRGGRRRGHLSM